MRPTRGRTSADGRGVGPSWAALMGVRRPGSLGSRFAKGTNSHPIEPPGGGPARMPVRGVRGATTVTRNQKEEILDVTKELLATMLEVNEISTEEIASAW